MGKCPWRGPRDLSSAYLHGELFSSLFFITKPLSCKVQKVNPFDTQNSLIQRLSNSFFPRSLDLLLTIFYASFVALSCKQMLLGLLSLKGSKTNWEASPTQSPWPSKTGKAFPLSLTGFLARPWQEIRRLKLQAIAKMHEEEEEARSLLRAYQWTVEHANSWLRIGNFSNHL